MLPVLPLLHIPKAELPILVRLTFLYRFFDSQKGVTLVGHCFRLTFSPGVTRKSFEVILLFML